MKKLILLSLAALAFTQVASAAEKGDLKNYVNPLSGDYKSVESGGSLSADEAYKDGVGAFVVAGDEKDRVINTAMNNLTEQYGEAAAKSGMTLDEYILSGEAGTVSPETRAKAEEIRDRIAARLKTDADCPTGLKLVGDQCEAGEVKIVPAECPTGFTMGANGICETGSITYTTPKCDSGLSLSNGKCIGTKISYVKAKKTTIKKCPSGYSPYSGNLCIKWGVGFAWKTTSYKYSCSTGTLSGGSCKTTTSVSETPKCDSGVLSGGKCKIDTRATKPATCESGAILSDGTCKVDTRVIAEPTCPPRTFFNASSQKCEYGF